MPPIYPEPGGVLNSEKPQHPKRWTFERGRFWVKENRKDDIGKSPGRTNLDFSFREVFSPVADGLAGAMGLPDARVVLSRLGTGRRCFAAWSSDRIVAYCWISRFRECIGELEQEIHFPPDEAYIWDCATLPNFRHQGVYTGLLQHILAVLKSEGIARVWIGSSLENTNSWHGFMRAGFTPVATLSYLRLYNLRLMQIVGMPQAPSDQVAAIRRIFSSDWQYVWGPFGLDYFGKPPVIKNYSSPCSDELAKS